MQPLRIRAPATSANLGPGYDVLALALKDPFDVMDFRRTEEGVTITSSGYEVPLDPPANCAGYVAMRMIEAFGLKGGVSIHIRKQIRPASGLGSSAASAAGAAYGMNELFTLGLTRSEMAEYASLGEIVSAGVPHYDNVVACIYGGLTITYSSKPIEVERLDPPRDIGIVIASPSYEKGSTRIARSVVPQQVPMKSMVHNVGRASLLAAGMAVGSISMIKRAMDDAVVEIARARAGILREFEALKTLAAEKDFGVAASGAGPSILAVVEKNRLNEVGSAIHQLYVSKGYLCEIIYTEPGEGISLLARARQRDGP